MTPLWQHIITVLALLTSNAVTFTICKRRIEELRAALVAKKVLLGDETPSIRNYWLRAGETVSLRRQPGSRVDITALTNETKLRVAIT